MCVRVRDQYSHVRVSSMCAGSILTCACVINVCGINKHMSVCFSVCVTRVHVLCNVAPLACVLVLILFKHIYTSLYLLVGPLAATLVYACKSLYVFCYGIIPCQVVQCLHLTFFDIWCNLAHELTLAPNRQVKNISAISAIISKLQELYFLLEIDKKNTNISQGYFTRSLLFSCLLFSCYTGMSSMFSTKELKMLTVLI